MGPIGCSNSTLPALSTIFRRCGRQHGWPLRAEVEPFSDTEQKLEQPFDGAELKYRFGRTSKRAPIATSSAIAEATRLRGSGPEPPLAATCDNDIDYLTSL
jgi:hypothetical protein